MFLWHERKWLSIARTIILILFYLNKNREKNNGAENALRLNLYRSSQENHEGNSYAVKSVPESEKIIFSWSEINVFTLTNGSGGLGFLRNCFKNDSNPKQGKQILKTGTLKLYRLLNIFVPVFHKNVHELFYDENQVF